MRLFLGVLIAVALMGFTTGRPDKYKHLRASTLNFGSHLDGIKHKAIPPSCDSKIYCQGKLLHTVQMAEIFKDSKHFVDMMMLDDEKNILAKFDAFMEENQQKPSRDKVMEFVNENFADANELDKWTPSDFEEEPSFLETIHPEEIRTFAKEINAIWPQLGRKISNDTLQNIERHSLLPLTKGFIVPGGRFKETYYWDTYWIVKGLLISGMSDTTRDMLDNFVTLIKLYGFIPNGARVYYLQRSQPPLFAPMVLDYFSATGDREWLSNNIWYVDQEVQRWLDHLVTVQINGSKYKVARYFPESKGPRPESYKEDFRTAAFLRGEEAKTHLYSNLKGGAESGWDFSVRWFYDAQGGYNANLSTIDTERTIPVDLNAFLYKACHSLHMLYSGIHQLEKASYWLEKAIHFKHVIRDVFFNEEDGMWYDFDNKLKKHRREFFVSNLTPLWVRAVHTDFDAEKLIQKLHDDGIFEYEGGTPASVKRTGEQWDLPNAWPPLQAITVQALANTQTENGQNIAMTLAKRWVRANLIGYRETGYMFEKYDAEQAGHYGGGGEYQVQSGFGWANGVALEFIHDYFSEDELWRRRLL